MGITIARLHYLADPAKRGLWAETAKARCPSDTWWRQEMEIDFGAALGALLVPEFNRNFTVCKPFPLNSKDHTKYMCIDPHPRVAHAMLWLAADRWGSIIVYRDYWASKMYGKPGNIPEDDDMYHIDDYVNTIKFLESSQVNCFGPNGYADNGGQDERIYLRVMDPAGKAFATRITDGKREPETMWGRYRDEGIVCVEAKKDFLANRDRVGRGLRPRTIIDGDGEHKQSEIIIFDTCQELILELESARFPKLSPSQAERIDPKEQALRKRKHMLDCLFYLMAEEPQFYDPTVTVESVPPVAKGIGY